MTTRRQLGALTLSEDNRRVLAVWAEDCAERTLPLFEPHVPGDTRPREAIDGVPAFARGDMRIGQLRTLSARTHAAAREVGHAAAVGAGSAVALPGQARAEAAGGQRVERRAGRLRIGAEVLVAGVRGCTSKCGADADKCNRHRWQYDVELPTGPKGERQRDVKGGFDTAKEAVDARAEVLRQFKAGTRSLDPRMTLGEWLPKWLAARIERGELRDSTAADYRDSIDRYLIPRLGHLKLIDLRAAHITAAYDAMRRDRAEAIKAAEEINVQRRAEAAEKNGSSGKSVGGWVEL